VTKMLSLLVLFALVAPVPAAADEPVDQQMIAKIKTEAFQNSKVMETVSSIADGFGPRLTGSPELKAAGEWCRDEMARWGLKNARLEAWGTIPRTWSVRRYSAEMTAPAYMRINAVPKAWTPGTSGVLAGTPVFVEVKSKDDFEKYRGKLKGAIVMNGKPEGTGPRFEPLARRLTDAELGTEAGAVDPGEPRSYADEAKEWEKFLADSEAITKFWSEEGIAALLEPSGRGPGVVRVAGQSYTLDSASLTFPAFVVAAEHYGRIMRLLERKVPVRIELSVDAAFVAGPTTGYNVVAEIPGTDPKLKDEVVLIGGHLDSWHAGTGATDNAAGCAAVMEAARVLVAIGARPRRTIRVALWGGEEQDYFGSAGYVKKHYGDPMTGALGPEHGRLAAYFNLDNGAGRIRGVYLQGNEAVRPIFEAYLRPFAYLGATALTTKNTGATDHMPFEALGLPAFQFVQDPLDYDTRTHHTSLDVYESIVPDDLKQAAAVVASFAYHTANRTERLPREAPPKPAPKS
jgi:carboxypeptidase Q